MDLISVIMPFYKKKPYFFNTLKSVLNQSYKNIEIIIIYDDHDMQDLSYINSLVSNKENISVVLNNKNIGVAKSRNIGIEKSNGKFIAFIDCDDVWLPEKTELQFKFMYENNLNISHTNYKIIDDKNNILGENISKDELTYNELINSCDIGLSTVMCKREVFNISKFKDIKTKEDYALWLELSRKGEKFKCLNKSLVLWRKTPNSLSSSFFNKIINGYKVYYKFEKKNLLISFFLVINLGLHYLKKRLDQKKRI